MPSELDFPIVLSEKDELLISQEAFDGIQRVNSGIKKLREQMKSRRTSAGFAVMVPPVVLYGDRNLEGLCITRVSYFPAENIIKIKSFDVKNPARIVIVMGTSLNGDVQTTKSLLQDFKGSRGTKPMFVFVNICRADDMTMKQFDAFYMGEADRFMTELKNELNRH